MDDIDAMLDVAAAQLAELQANYKKSLTSKDITSAMRVQIKNIVENQRSALEHYAYAATEAYGKAGARSYYPIAIADGDFLALFNQQMPGVAANRPDIRDSVRLYQPYQNGYAWLAHLNTLSNENKHRRLSPQTKVEEQRREVHGTGGSVSWTPGNVTFGGGVFINGEPVDPVTQRTASTIDVTYVDWLFTDVGVSVLGLLSEIQDKLPGALTDLCKTANL